MARAAAQAAWGWETGTKVTLGQLWRVGPHCMFGWRALPGESCEPWHQASAEDGPLVQPRGHCWKLNACPAGKDRSCNWPNPEPGTLGTVHPLHGWRDPGPGRVGSWGPQALLLGPRSLAPGCPHPAPSANDTLRWPLWLPSPRPSHKKPGPGGWSPVVPAAGQRRTAVGGTGHAQALQIWPHACHQLGPREPPEREITNGCHCGAKTCDYVITSSVTLLH